MHFSIITTLATLLTIASTTPVHTIAGDGGSTTTTTTTNPSTRSIERRDMTGRGTYFLQQGGRGSCGILSPDSAMIVALGTAWRDVGQKNCGRTIWVEAISGPGSGNRIEAKVQDTCPGCDSNAVDFSVGAFSKLTNNNNAFGLIQVRWNFV